MPQPRLSPLLLEPRCRGIPPAALLHEAIEELDVLSIGLTPLSKAPIENLFICSPLQGACCQRLVANPQKTAHTVVKCTLPFNHTDDTPLATRPGLAA